MAPAVRVTFAASAVADLEEILAYHAEQEVPDVGERTVREIMRHIEGLRIHPDKGRVVPEFGMKHLRELIHPPFRIVYRRDPGAVRVVRVRRGERIMKRAGIA
jgi:plasmid stabilization system protein ParE